MATIQDLLAQSALNQQNSKSPFMSLAEGAVQGFGQGLKEAPAIQKARLENQVTQLAMAENQANRERAIQADADIRAKLAGSVEAGNQQRFKATSGYATVAAPAKLQEKYTQDPKTGLYSNVEIASAGGGAATPSGDSIIYHHPADPVGVNRLGSYDKRTQTYSPPSLSDPIALAKDAAVGGGVGGEKHNSEIQRAYTQIINKYDANAASSRTVMGTLGRANRNIQVALTTLESPTLTNEAFRQAIGDMAQTYQGGAATEAGMTAMEASTLRSRIAGMTQYLTGKPQDAIPAGIKQQMVSQLVELQKTHQRMAEGALNKVEKAQKRLLGDPYLGSQWADFKSAQIAEVGPNVDGPYSGTSAPGGLTPAEQDELKRLEARFGGGK